MADNPNPARITAAEWRFWQEAQQIIPGVRLGGIWAAKSGYHSSRDYNRANHPGNYSVRLALDKQGPSDKSAAVDLTMSDTQMRKRTRYLRDSALDPDDDRLWALREFYGTLDSRTVYGLIKDNENGPWRRSSADDTHLWHEHLSWLRAFVEQWEAFEPVLSVLAGETHAQWKARQAGGDDMAMLPIRRSAVEGQESEDVQYWQLKLRELGYYDGDIDGLYGPATSAAVLAARQAAGSSASHGDVIEGYGAWQIDQQLLALGRGGGEATAEQVRSAVEAWLEQHRDELRGEDGTPGKTPQEITLELTGTVTKVA